MHHRPYFEVDLLPGSVEENPNLGSAVLVEGALDGNGHSASPMYHELDGYRIGVSSTRYSRPAPNAFNKSVTDTNDIWHSATTSDVGAGLPEWISIEYPTPVFLHSYSLTSRSTPNGLEPYTWYLQASMDGSTWSSIGYWYRVGSLGYTGVTESFAVENTSQAFLHYRLYIIETIHSGDQTIRTNGASIAQWKLYTTPNPGLGKLLAKNTLATQSVPGQIRQQQQMPVQAVSYQDLVSLISVSRKDLVVNSGKTSVQDQASGLEWDYNDTVSLALEDSIPCVDLSAGSLKLNGTGATLGQEYTLVYYWKPSSNSDYKTLHRNILDHLVIIKIGATDLGMYSNRNGNFRDTGYNITPGVWQTLIVTSIGDTSTSTTGVGTFYVNDHNVGTVDRVGCGTRLWWFGNVGVNSQYPGHVAVAGVFNRVLSRKEITKVHRMLEGWGQGQYIQKIPRSIGFARNRQVTYYASKVWQADDIIPPLGARNLQDLQEYRSHAPNVGNYVVIDQFNPDASVYGPLDVRYPGAGFVSFSNHDSFDFTPFGYYIIIFGNTTTNQSFMEYTIDIQETGEYRVSLFRIAPGGDSNSIYFNILRNDIVEYGEVEWSSGFPFGTGWITYETSYTLTTGTVTLQVKGREPTGIAGIRLLKV
jgi:hypothetical protein